EISDFGIRIEDNTSSPSMLVNCRADLNFGNGYEIDGRALLTNCLSSRNGQETTNTYDGFSVSSTHVQLMNCRAASLTNEARHRYGFTDSTTGDSGKNTYVGCVSVSHETATFNFSGFASPAVTIPTGAP